MKDERVKKLAEIIINYSLELEKGEKLLIDNWGKDTNLLNELIKEARKVGALPHVSIKDKGIFRTLLLDTDEEHIKSVSKYDIERMKEMDAYVSLKAFDNLSEWTDIPKEKVSLYMEYYYKEVHMKLSVNKKKWCTLLYPTPAMAQAANMSTEAFEDWYYDVCILDYKKMYEILSKLKNLMENTDKVRIIAPNTDLNFSIKGIPTVLTPGKNNIPDGEIMTAPVKNSVEGYITYNIPSLYQGVKYTNVRLDFEKGKIVKVSADQQDKVQAIFDIDDGARYVGEFAIGYNPNVFEPIGDILFDEKISGSIHFTPGNCYKTTDNGNSSAVHWDLVLVMRKEYGGGKIYFDDKLICDDGLFVLDELMDINPVPLKEATKY